MGALAIVFANLAVLAGAIFGVIRSGQRPQVLLYAFVVEYGLRLLTIDVLSGALRGNGRAWLKPLVPLLSSPPNDEGRATSSGSRQQSFLLIDEHTKRPLGLGGYVVVTAFVAVLAFVFSHVTAKHQVEVDLASFVNDLRWASALGLVYGKPPTGWAVLGPLLAFRFVVDLALALRAASEPR